LVSLFAVAFVVALIATGMFYGLFIAPARGSAGTPPGPTIVVAARNLERNHVLAPEDVKTITAPDASSVEEGFRQPREVVGATVVEPVQAGEPLRQTHLAAAGRTTEVGGVPVGMRALTLHVTDSDGLVAMLRPGQRVDVQLVTGSGMEARLRTVLENVEIFNVPSPSNGRLAVNVLARPDEAELLGLADSAARLRLALRNPKDKSVVSRPTVTVSSMLNAPHAATAPTERPAAEVVRGSPGRH